MIKIKESVMTESSNHLRKGLHLGKQSRNRIFRRRRHWKRGAAVQGVITMEEIAKDSLNDRQETLKKIIKELHSGTPVEKLQKRFKKLIENTSPDEIANMENALIQEGFPPSEIQRLCDVHAQVFEKSLKKSGKTSKIPGHPIHTFAEENKEAKKILKKLRRFMKKIRKHVYTEELKQSIRDDFHRLKEIEKHYQRKENQLFPMLEAKQFTGPTQVMWGKHDEIRGMIRTVAELIENESWDRIPRAFSELSSAIKKLIFLEETILYPTSAKKLNEIEWAKIKKGEPEIGYAWITPSNLWDAELAKSQETSMTGTSNRNGGSPMDKEDTQAMKLSQGKLSADQIDLLLKNLPVDITFVDENDKVCYYSDTKERIFPRSPAIIGRAVQNCHPPDSVHIVESILNHFKEKKKDKAEFWIQKDGKFIYIRYFPIYDKTGTYRGVIEVSQEVSNIRALDGERRLLDW
jgi:DUF438 domain-containing protein